MTNQYAIIQDGEITGFGTARELWPLSSFSSAGLSIAELEARNAVLIVSQLPYDPTFQGLVAVPPYFLGDGQVANVVVETRPLSAVQRASEADAVDVAPAAYNDAITTELEAAQFLRKTTLGPTWREIQDLVSLGSKSKWITNQISACLDGSEYAEWESQEGFLVPKPGWHNEIARLMLPNPAISNIGPEDPRGQIVNRCYVTSLLYNNPPTGGVLDLEDPLAPKAPGHSFQNRVAWTLNKMFPTSLVGGTRQLHWDTAAWVSLTARYAFRPYEDLLEAITYSYQMPDLLTYWLNLKDIGTGTKPDENYAREIMQLFTVGQFKLDDTGQPLLDENGELIDSYSNEDVQEVAKIFTGFVSTGLGDSELSANNLNGSTIPKRREFHLDFKSYGHRKPLTVVKAGRFYIIRTVPAGSEGDYMELGATDPPTIGDVFLATSNGNENMSANALVGEERYAPIGECAWVVQKPERTDLTAKNVQSIGYSCPEGLNPESQVRGFIRALVRHPGTAPYVCLRLIRFSTTSNPSPGYVKRVVNIFRDNGRGEVGDMSAVWAAIFLDPEAQSDSGSSREFGRLRDFFESWCGLVRPLGYTHSLAATASPDTLSAFFWDGEHYLGNAQGQILGQLHNSGVNTGGGGPGGQEVRNLGGVWPGTSPSIFGYYAPDYSEPPAQEWGSMLPEAEIYDSAREASVLNRLEQIVTRGPEWIAGGGKGMQIETISAPSYTAALGLADLEDAGEITRRLNLLLCGGLVPDDDVNAIIATAESPPDISNRDERVKLIIQALINSFAFFIQ